MGDMIAERLKGEGNNAFSEKRYEDALVLYDKAIETDPNNYVYFNNRAAANHELKNYEQAIEDAKKSIAISDNAKAHVRIGAALWAQKKLPEAKAEFERAVQMEPSNTSAKDNVQKLERLLNPTPQAAPHPYAYRAAAVAAASQQPVMRGGEFTSVDSGRPGLLLAIAGALVGALCVVAVFISPAFSVQLWQYLMVVTIVQQGTVMYKKGLLRISMDSLRESTEHFCSAVSMLCLLALLSGVQPIIPIAMFLVLYDVVDIVNHKADLALIIGPAYNMALPYIGKIEANRTTILLFAASLEGMLVFTVMFTGGAIFTLIYMQYGKNRYRTDGYVKLAFTGMRMNATRFLTSYLPPIVNTYAQKAFDFVSTMAQQSF